MQEEVNVSCVDKTPVTAVRRGGDVEGAHAEDC